MSDNNNELKDIQTIIDEDNIPMTPYVNEKVKYYMIVMVVILSIASALLVIFGPNEDSKTNNSKPEATETLPIHK